ncbi:hypothetical protein [Shimazuella soli]|nr:hypothetical protein [Shimazuella soli]
MLILLAVSYLFIGISSDNNFLRGKFVRGKKTRTLAAGIPPMQVHF